MKRPRTRIVATVGPACDSVEMLEAMVHAGASVFRINGSHTAAADVDAWVRRIRAAGERAGRIVSCLLDLPGTKIRTGAFPGTDGVELEAGGIVELFPGRGGGGPTRIPIQAIRDLSTVAVGSHVLLDDGRIRLVVKRTKDERLVCQVVEGGTIRARKGVDFPGVRLPVKVPTATDLKLTRAGVAAGVDGLALSFVQHADDVTRLKAALQRTGAPDVPVVAKIERAAACEQLEGILGVTNAVMVARGDLGVDVGPEGVPTLQKAIIEQGRELGRPVVVATEMLESMTERTRPTRAEASDIAGAVFDGADGVMLSAETAIGKHPVLAVDTMARILLAAEADPHTPYAGTRYMRPPRPRRGRPDQHVVHAAVVLAAQTEAAAVVVFTRSGASAIRLSKERPKAPILAYTDSPEISRRLTFGWGIRPRRLPGLEGTDRILARVAKELRDEGLPPGSRVVAVMGGPEDPAGTTSLIKMLQL